jgi:hypothetical protein
MPDDDDDWDPSDELPPDDGEDDCYDYGHECLTAAERNPSLCRR